MLKVLSEQEIEDIHEATVDILANRGVKILNDRMLAVLKEKGLDVDEENQIVRFSRDCLEDALSQIPPTFEVFDRDGNFAFILRRPKAKDCSRSQCSLLGRFRNRANSIIYSC